MTDDKAQTSASAKTHYGPGQNPNSRRNLVLFTKDKRPAYPPVRGPLITPRIQYLLTLSAEEFASWRPKTVADGIAWRYVSEALAGGLLSEKGRQEVIERADGKVPDRLVVSEEPASVRSLRELQERLRLEA